MIMQIIPASLGTYWIVSILLFSAVDFRITVLIPSIYDGGKKKGTALKICLVFH